MVARITPASHAIKLIDIKKPRHSILIEGGAFLIY